MKEEEKKPDTYIAVFRIEAAVSGEEVKRHLEQIMKKANENMPEFCKIRLSDVKRVKV